MLWGSYGGTELKHGLVFNVINRAWFIMKLSDAREDRQHFPFRTNGILIICEECGMCCTILWLLDKGNSH